jgi:glutamate synthase domain-containing protein 2/glutamate synthase domain-containing protein 1/glutamate synthase domain-containing protein 3
MQHDACGVGFVARTAGLPGHDIVRHGLTALVRLAHRGAPPSLGAVDGCGLLTAIPWTLVTASLADRMPAGRRRALGMFFTEPSARDAAVALVERELEAVGALVAWRDVPTDRKAVLKAQRATTPDVLQAAIAFPDGKNTVEERLFRARMSIAAQAARRGVRLDVISLSTATVVYKGLVTPDALEAFYPDLADDRFASKFVVFHQRYSTNTSADWALAQPFRVLAHNGEINTIGGNRAWTRARLLDQTSIRDLAESAVLSEATSDSGSLDEAVDLLRHRGYSIAHALSRLIPPAWERDRDLAPDVRAFHEFQSLLSEPWDGPSALAFADGRFVGAALDRNGFRPARVVRTAAGLVAVASEVGILDSSEHEIVHRGRLGPGDMLIVDLDRGAVLETNDIRRRLAFRRRYRRMLADTVRSLSHATDLSKIESAPIAKTPTPSADALLCRQTAFGCSREEIELLLKPMATEGHEAVGSMGDDTPPAALSRKSRLFTDFFRQRFAQVTNPPVDPYRESAVMSLTTLVGAQGSYVDELARRPARIILRSPILTPEQLGQLRTATSLAAVTIATVFRAGAPSGTLRERVGSIAEEACRMVRRGAALIVLSDVDIDAEHAPLPALLATAAVHHALIDRGLRLRASIVVETGDARDAHQVAALCAFGASAVCPTLGYDTVSSLGSIDTTGCSRAIARYRLALDRGLLTILSKMGVCTFSSYCGSQLFEILGLDSSLARQFFPGTPAFAGSVGLDEIEKTILERHARAFAAVPSTLEYPGLHGYRRDGEYHATNPLVVRGLQKARDAVVESDSRSAEALRSVPDANHAYATFTSHVYNRPAAAVRDLLDFATSNTSPIPIDRVEPIDEVCRRFFASAMSVGALSPEAHRAVARAMNMLGARSNSGEGGEEPDRFDRPNDLSTWTGSRTKQVASARFGVTPAYLRSADELQIKIAQGSKPGEGGQLPALKVVPHIAKLRHAQPGTTLISPPVHHDIYSIEDLAQLIHDLRVFHPAARMNVKLVASSGVGIIAAGVAKAGADAIQISGHDGGTGASPRASIKHAGLPWELGLNEAHRALVRAGLRHRVVLQTDGGLKTGRDIAMAAALGADEYGFGTAALVAIGCVMARQCHANTCPVGIATQREDLRQAFSGTPEMLVGYLRLIAGEVREILASLGVRSVGDLVGRSDLLRTKPGAGSLPLDVARLLSEPEVPSLQIERSVGLSVESRKTKTRTSPTIADRVRRGELPITIATSIRNTDRTFGADVAGVIAAHHGDAGLPDGSVAVTTTGSAGQSFGAFLLPGMWLSLVGDANDGLGKGMHGGDIVVSVPARERGRPDQVLCGNAALYGATGGRVYIAGRAGERFAVRNSGATAVVEGVGDHACEYMTGGTVVVLGSIGRNFGSGMTGGIAYVCDRRRTLVARTNPQHLVVEALTPSDQKVVRHLLETHERLTGSRLARAILRHDRSLTTFRRIASVANPAAVAETVNERLPGEIEASSRTEKAAAS